MHELSIAASLLDAMTRAADENGAAKVTSARVRVGSLSCVNDEALRFGFEALARDTVAAGCVLEVVKPPASGRCAECEWSGDVEDAWVPACPQCGHYPIALRGTDEITLESIEVP